MAEPCGCQKRAKTIAVINELLGDYNVAFSRGPNYSGVFMDNTRLIAAHSQMLWVKPKFCRLRDEVQGSNWGPDPIDPTLKDAWNATIADIERSLAIIKGVINDAPVPS